MPRQAVGAVGSLPDGTPNPISPAVRAGDFVYISGLMPKDAEGQISAGDIAAQTTVVMDRLVAVLDLAGCSTEDIVKCMVWLTAEQNFKAFNDVYASYFKGSPPARSAVKSDLLLPGALLELEAICYKPISR